MRNREEGGNHPEKTPGPGSTRPGRARLTSLPAPSPGLPAAGPPDVTVPASSLLNFKSSSLAQPGGGGFLGRRRFRTLGTPALPAPSAPEGCAHRLPRPGPGSPRGSLARAGAWAGRGRGGAWAAEGGCARARREVARRLRPRKAAARSRRQRREIPHSRAPGSPAAAARPRGASPPGFCTLDGRRRAIRSARIQGVGRCEPQTRGGRAGGRRPGGGLGDAGVPAAEDGAAG